MTNVTSTGQHSGLRQLCEEVLETDACTACGGCVSICSNILALGDRIAAIADCEVEKGRCYHFCPRTVPFSEAAGLAGDVGYKGALGPYLDSYLARGVDIAEGAPIQYGGVVSTLMSRALAEGLINGAVVTRASEGSPYPLTVSTREGIFSAAGSKFALSPTNMQVNSSTQDPGALLGAAALPCQCTGLRKMQLYPREEANEGAISLLIGLFCTWALTQRGWQLLLQNLGANEIKRADIPPPPAEVMELTSRGGKHELPLDEVKTHIRPGCHVCTDMTAENADISVGIAEGLPGYNLVFTRTEKGRALFKNAVDAGLLETSSPDAARFGHLSEASLNKKKRALKNAQERGAELPYYQRLIKLKERINSNEA